MVESLKKSIEILKERVRANLEILHQNERNIKEILKEPVSKIRSDKLNKRFISNKKILKENNDAILLQKEILLFIEKHFSDIKSFPDVAEGNEEITYEIKLSNQIVEIKKEDYLDLTISGAMDFDNNHPLFQDKDFFNALLSYYTEIEDYETCSKLAKLVKENNISEY